MKITKSSGNIFEDLGFDAAESMVLKLRSSLMISIRKEIEERGLTQVQAGKLFGVSQPRISDLVRGKIEEFTVESLMEMLAKIGVRVSFTVGIPQTLIPGFTAYIPDYQDNDTVAVPVSNYTPSEIARAYRRYQSKRILSKSTTELSKSYVGNTVIHPSGTSYGQEAHR